MFANGSAPNDHDRLAAHARVRTHRKKHDLPTIQWQQPPDAAGRNANNAIKSVGHTNN